MQMLRRQGIALLFAALPCACALAQYAASYPGKPTHVIVPYPAGGVVDGLMRSIGQPVSESVGQTVIVDNRPGANTIIALVAGAKAPYDTVRDMIDHAKRKPGAINFASFGMGSTPHFFVEWFNKVGEVDIVHVPYKGSAQIIPALLSGEADATFIAMGIVLPMIKSGKMKALAVTGPRRSPYLPDVPTLAEQGIDPRRQNWFGVFAPARTPKAVVERLNAEFVKALRHPRFEEQFLKIQAFDAVGNSPADFADFLKADRANAKQVIARTGIRLDAASAR